MPNLTDVYLPSAFKYKDDVTMRGSTHFIPLSQIDIGEFGYYSGLPRHIPIATVFDLEDWNALDTNVTEIIVNSGALNDPSMTVLDLTRFSHLESLTIGEYCFSYVSVFNITGLSELESVVIGMNSFTKQKDSYGSDPNRHFYLKNCPKLKSLKMGRYSFSDYTVIEIENVDTLEVIEMGDLNERSYNFDSASLELRGILIHRE